MKAKICKRILNNLHPDGKELIVYDTETKGFFLRIHPSGNMVYYCQLGRGKKIKIAHVKEISPSQARDAAQKLLAELKMGKDPIAEKKKRQNKGKTLAAFLEDEYGPDFILSKKTGTETLKRIKRCFANLLQTPLEEITIDKINRWKRKRLEVDGVSKSTINREIESVKAVIRSAYKEYKIIDHNPLADLKKFKLDNSRVRFLSNDEEMRLRRAIEFREQKLREKRARYNKWLQDRKLPLYPSLENASFADHIAPLVLLAMNTGARRGELFSLSWDDVDLDLAMMTIRGTHAKSGRTRHIPLNEEAMKVLAGWREQQAQNALVFPGKGGKRLDNIKTAWEGVLALAEIENFTFHDLRHHFASRLVMAGVDLNTVRELLGHADLKMTLRYAHLAPKAKAAAVAKLVTPQATCDQAIPMTSYKS